MLGRCYVFYFYFYFALRTKIFSEKVLKPINIKEKALVSYAVLDFIDLLALISELQIKPFYCWSFHILYGD